ncbi:MAG: hypothetical protein M0C28_24370 [Candidatus Moduliflexus flocculans]|nr:hypothetical protein [Candidatus Moduliflexus flocculans]
MMYDAGRGTSSTARCRQDRTHYFKAYGSYAFPFGLTVGLVGLRPERPARDHQALLRRQVLSTPRTAATWAACRSPSGPTSTWTTALKLGAKSQAAPSTSQLNNVTNTRTVQSRVGTTLQPGRLLRGCDDGDPRPGDVGQHLRVRRSSTRATRSIARTTRWAHPVRPVVGPVWACGSRY